MTSAKLTMPRKHQEATLRALNLLIRLAVPAVKFLSILVFAKALSVEDFATYGLILAYTSFFGLVYGMDFYAYTHRFFVTETLKPFVLRKHLKLASAMAPLQAVVALIWLFSSGFSGAIVFLVMVLFMIEYISQELYRYLILEEKQIRASLSLAMRQAVWMVPLATYGIIANELSLALVLASWILGAIISIGIAVKPLTQYLVGAPLSDPLSPLPNFIFEGLKLSFKFLIGSLCLKAVFVVDRYVLSSLPNPEHLAAYAFIMSFCMIIYTAVDASILSFYYRRILSGGLSSSQFYKLLLLVAAVSAGISIVSGAMLKVSVSLFSLDEIYNQLDIFFYGALAISCYVCSMVPHYFIYQKRADTYLILSHVSLGVVFSGLLILINVESALDVSKLLAIVMAAFLTLKIFIWLRVKTWELPSLVNEMDVQK